MFHFTIHFSISVLRDIPSAGIAIFDVFPAAIYLMLTSGIDQQPMTSVSVSMSLADDVLRSCFFKNL